MRNDRNKAIFFRKKGQSYNKISSRLNIPKSTLSTWFKKFDWSHELSKKLNYENSFKSYERRKTAIQSTKRKWDVFYENAKQNAVNEFPKLKDNPLFIAGLMLYWSQGDKQLKNGNIRLSSNDPELSKLFYQFIIHVLGCQKNKVIARLILYPDLIDGVQKNFWSKTTGIPLSQFRASTVIPSKHPSKRLSYGVCIIQHTNKALKEKIIKWIELYSMYANAQFLKLE